MLNLQQGQTVNLVAAFHRKHADGTVEDIALPAGVVPAWATDNASINNITSVADDGMSAVGTAGTTNGVANITATATYPDGDTAVATIALTTVDAEDNTGDITATANPV